MVNCNRFWIELSNENKTVEMLEKTVKYVQS